MEKKEFQAESKRLLDLMIHSIYTHKEIFLRELVSNASDAVDKLAYLALTDDKVGLNRSDFAIWIKIDKENRTLTISDNGIGMTKEELENNLGVIARSGSLQFKEKLDQAEAADVDIIGQFGVGFYSAFMVSDTVTVRSKAYGGEQAYEWVSSGADGYTISPCDKETAGTDIIMQIKEDSEEERYSRFLDSYQIQRLIKKYSDYIRYPIKMEVEKSRMKDKPEDAPEDYKPEWETYTEVETLNSMVPLWQRNKDEVTQEELNAFYKEHFGDYEDPLLSIQVSVEGAVTYKALLFVPSRAPYNFYTREYEKGLALYSSGVMIMEKCADLLPEHFRFVRGVVDSQDFSLNLSRELLQHTRQLKVVSTNLEKKVKSELLKLQTNDFEAYKKFWTAFGIQLKYGVVADYGAHKELLRDLLLFQSSNGDGGLTTLSQYVSRMPEDQKNIYYAAGETADRIAKLPQAERFLTKGYEVLYLTDEIDEFTLQTLAEQEGKQFKSINDDDALPETEEEKAETEKQAEENKDLLQFVKETLGDKIKEARISKKLLNHPVCMTTDGPISLEMERYFNQMKAEGIQDVVAQRVLELNPNSHAFTALQSAFATDKETAKKYVEILYQQSLLIAGLPIEDPSAYADLVCSLMK